MSKDYSREQVSVHYADRHRTRGGVNVSMPYANYGYWTRPGMTFDEACEALTDLIARELNVTAEDDVLDIGCGYGASAIYLAQHFHPRSVKGIDATEVRIETGRKLVAERQLDQVIELNLGDATSIGYPDHSFTRIMAIECAFHFNTRERFFHEAFRVLKPGGVLAMTDITFAPDFDLGGRTHEELRQLLWADAKMYGDANIYGQDTYRKHLADAGFNPFRLYSIKEQCARQFGEHMIRSAEQAPNEEIRARRTAYGRSFLNEFMQTNDYVVVRAEKPR